MEKRIAKWDNLKGFLIILVVIGHFIESSIEYSLVYKKVWTMIYFIHMPLMIFIAGMFIKNTVSTAEKAVKKMFFYANIYVLYKIIIMIEKMIITGKTEFHLLSENGVPWFMLAMVWFIGITYMIKNVKPIYAILSALLLSCVIGYDSGINDYLVLARTINFYPFFLMGYHTKISPDMFRITKKKKIFSYAVLGGFIAFVCLFIDKAYRFRPLITGRNTYYKYNNPQYGWIYRLVCFAIICLVGYSLIIITTNKKTFLASVGKKSLQIYFVHGIIVRVFMYCDIAKLVRIKLPNYWEITILSMAIVAVGLSLLSIYKKMYNRMVM